MVVSESLSVAVDQTPGPGGPAKRMAVNIAGRGSDVAFIIDEDAPMEIIARDLCEQLSGRGALFSEGGVSVNVGSRNLTYEEKAEIRRVFEENSGLTVSRFVSTIGDGDPESGEDSQEALPRYPWRFLARRRSPLGAGASLNPLTRFSRESQRNRNQALLIRSTFRSGESIHHYGDVVLLGDMNPGSEIKADGDIVVMGALKGLPHAGASGDDKAAIIALKINAPRLRIGNCEAALRSDGKSHRRSRRGKEPDNGQLSIAYTKQGVIYVSPFDGRFARYKKGVAYDG